MDAQRFGHDVTHRQHRVQRRIRVLEDVLHVAPHAAHAVAPQAGDVLPVEHHTPAGLGDQAHDGAPGGGLATTGFADQPHGLAGVDHQADTVHGADPADTSAQQAGLDGVIHLQPVDNQQGVACAGFWRSRRTCDRRGARRGIGQQLCHLVREVAGTGVARCHGAQGRVLRGTHRTVTPDGAPRVKGATRGQLRRCRWLAVDGHQPAVHRVDAGNAAQQADGVGMARLPEDLLHPTRFDDAPAVHHSDLVRHFRHHTEVMRDQDHRGAGVGLSLCQHRQHLGLHGHVERGGGFVGNDECGPARHRHGDHGALAHATRELVRVLVHTAFGVGDVDLAQQRDRALRRVGSGHLPMGHLALDHLAADGKHRVERGGRILEHHAHVAPPHLPQGLGPQGRDLDAIELDRALHLGRERQQATDGQRGHTLARPRLAHDAQHFVGIDIEVDAAHRRHRATGTDEGDRQSTYAERQRNPMVRNTGMLSISRTMPPTFLAATIRPMS